MSFSVFWPCMGTASFCAPRILAEGAIERQSHRNLITFLSNAKARKNDFFPSKARILAILTGNGSPEKYAADAAHVFEAGKYGGYFTCRTTWSRRYCMNQP
jgi:hypothetical protein